ncbi:class I SAM-dependent DNA methyltransferase [Paramaledivibacter caminithermalis]|jgi:SAM-dependent methyltransferase|uniref:Methyltransferase domain-containing protein n=1 Tax=Paramaledivibacter caminithermalis (strain DSM 15212 / CIP 107654 / DViRD3) TaxID=1121301 RepID=A0A1M6R006_PARC5|nr:class I SAM-dependent methyltransferase [Paramaledivibacter caminithermalis]SHK25763.1 Methyltransferase domain-containing protein [Paramaledivibacter caminithermalis DSM 15212]
MDQYKELSKIYDALIPEPINFFQFYLEKIREKDNPTILDFGCGTGRLAIFLSSYAKEIDAFDISESMIEKGMNKLKELKIKNINITVDNFLTSQSFTKNYDFILLSGGVFEYFLTPEEQQQNLNKIADKLGNEAKLIIDIEAAPFISNNTTKHLYDSLPNKSTDEKTSKVKVYQKRAYNFEKQLKKDSLSVNLNGRYYNIEYISRYTYLQELRYLFEKCNLKIIAEYGDFLKNKINKNSQYYIIEAIKGV